MISVGVCVFKGTVKLCHDLVEADDPIKCDGLELEPRYRG